MLLLASCQSYGRTTGRPGTPTPVASTKVGGGIVFVSPSPSASAPTTAGQRPSAPVFVLTVRDQNGNRPAGIRVRFDGKVHRVLESGATGTVRFSAPAGTYSMHIDKGCYPLVLVSQGVFGTIHLYQGVTRNAEVRVGWQHRFGPGGASTPDAAGDWKVGTPVHIRYPVIDRCKNDLAPHAGYPTFVFHPSANLVIVGTPAMTADASGRGSVTVRCRAPGDAQLVLGDARNPPDRTDLVGDATGYNGRPRCAR